MATRKAQFRQLHRALAPILLLPLVLTLITGSVFQLFDMQGQGDSVGWLMEWHKGHFGSLNLEKIYPFLIAAGLLVLSITGFSMWLQSRRRSRPEPQ